MSNKTNTIISENDSANLLLCSAIAYVTKCSEAMESFELLLDITEQQLPLTSQHVIHNLQCAIDMANGVLITEMQRRSEDITVETLTEIIN